MKTLFLVLIAIIVVTGSIGTSYALVTHGEAVNIFGQLQVVDSNMVVTRTDGSDTGLSVKNSGAANVFQFFDVDDNQVYRFKLNADGNSFTFLDATAGQNNLVVQLPSGNIGIGEDNPQERLDVGGDLHVRDGTITADGDICIGACP